jgi:hypothetical protein
LRSLRLRQRIGDTTGAVAQLRLLAPSTQLAEVSQAWAEELGATLLMRDSEP